MNPSSKYLKLRGSICSLIATATLLLVVSGCEKKVEPVLTKAKAEDRNLSVSVTATGTIEPVTSVEVGTQVSGIIDKIYVDYNSVVKKGEIIAELDKTNLMSELSNAQTNLSNSRSTLAYQKANFDRYKTLYDKGLIAANEYEQARLSYEQARNQVTIDEQNVTKAKTNLGYATITAPIDGVVLSKEVEEGQTVASAMTTPTLFIIAQDLTDMRVIANVDEADIGQVAVGQRVTFTVDAFPDDVFEGAVTQVRQEATTESNVVTYEVVISARNDDLKLKPGLTANVTIFTQERDNVLCVPAKALKFNPTPEFMPKDMTIENTDAPVKVWVQDDNVLKALPVTTGITAGGFTQIESGIKAGTEVVTAVSLPGMGDEDEEESNSNPFMPGPPGRNKKK